MKIGDTCKVGKMTYRLEKRPDGASSICQPCAGLLQLEGGQRLCGSLGECFVWDKEGRRITCVWIRKEEK